MNQTLPRLVAFGEALTDFIHDSQDMFGDGLMQRSAKAILATATSHQNRKQS